MKIESYSFGSLVVDGRSFNSDVIIYPDRVDDSWWRDEGHSVSIDDIRDIVDFNPRALVIGKGSPGLMSVPESTREFVQSKGIELVVQGTGKACKTYNELSGTKKVVAALHLTC